MMKTLFALLICLTIVSFSYAQNASDSIRLHRSRFYQGADVLKPVDVMKRMEGNPQAFQAFKKAKSNYDAAQVFGFAGGALIGWPLGTALGGGDPQWGLAAGGAALVLIGIPLNNAFKRHARTALDIYNAGEPSSRTKPELKFYYAGTQAKLVLKF